jgi:hypothetical protein
MFSCQHCGKPDARIRAVKNRDAAYYPEQLEKLEEGNLFGIRKWNLSCTKAGAKTSQKLDT